MNIYDIAAKCEVSIATVSRVLNGSNKVSSKTKKRVLSIMEKEHYQPNPFARGLGLNSMKMIGVICEDVSDAFYAKAISLIEEHLRFSHLDVILSCTGKDNAPKYKYLQLLIQKHVDAIIIIGTPFHLAKDIDYIKNIANKTPIILVNNYIKHDNIYCVICDENEGMENIVDKLADKGHKNILYLYNALTYSGRQKLQGYQRGIAKNHLSKAHFLQKKVICSLDDVEKTVSDLLSQNMRFDAVIAAEDLIAVGAQKAILRANKKIPIIGCNNSILAQCVLPSITSLDNQLNALCHQAADLLTRLKANENVPTKFIFPAKLIERESFVFTKKANHLTKK